jgi:predicted ester cyclase
VTLEQLARRYYAAFNGRRLEEAEQFVDPHAVFHYLPTKQRLIGRAGYRDLAAAWLHAFEDAHLEIESVSIADARTLVVQFLGNGTHTGDLVLGEHVVIPPTDRNVQLPFSDRLTIVGGLITESQLDFDLLELRKRLLGE